MSQPPHQFPLPPHPGPGPWPIGAVDGPGAPVPPASRPRRNRLVPVLAVVAALLLMGTGVLTALLVDARANAADRAAAERAEDERQATELGDAERGLAEAEARVVEAEAAASQAADAARAAEAAQDEAEQAAAPGADDHDEFLRLLRSTDPAFRFVAEADVIELGEITCDYFDTFGNSDQTLAQIVSIGVSSGMTSQQSAAVTSAAIVALCPQHTLD